MLQKEEEVLLECTFTPATNRDKFRLKSYVPLPDRAFEIQQNKKEKLSRIKTEKVQFLFCFCETIVLVLCRNPLSLLL